MTRSEILKNQEGFPFARGKTATLSWELLLGKDPPLPRLSQEAASEMICRDLQEVEEGFFLAVRIPKDLLPELSKFFRRRHSTVPFGRKLQAMNYRRECKDWFQNLKGEVAHIAPSKNSNSHP
jgi:hypothetical protein